MPRSLKLRAAAGAVLWCALALISVGWAIHQLQIRSAERQFDTWLSAHLTELAASVAIAAPNAETIANRMPDPRFHQPFSGFYWQAQGPQAMLYSRSLWDTQLALPQDELPDGALHRHDIAGPNQTGLRVLERTVRRADGEVWRIAVAADRKILDHETRRFSHALIISLAVLGLVLGLAAIAQTALVLRPLNRLRAALTAYRDGKTHRLSGAFPIEITPLADDLNALLDRNDQLVTRARRQAADLAHGLKTPIAVLRNDLTHAAQRLTPQQLAELTHSLDQIENQTRRQLARARIALRGPQHSVPVQPVIAKMLPAFNRLYADRTLSIEQAIDADARFPGDAENLQEVLGNVLENACQWAASRIRISAACDPEGLRLTVEDDGPGIPQAAQQAILRPGARLDTQTPGNGLGLAIVADIVEAHQGAISLGKSPLGGLKVEITLPRQTNRQPI